MEIGNFKINKNSSVFIIAELSANHGGDIQIAIESIKAAKRAGANCIKLQTYKPETITLDSDKDDFILKETIWKGRNLYNLYQEAFTPWEWHEKLFEIAKQENIVCFSSPFDNSAVDLLEDLNTPAYKIASFEITDIPLIRYVASKQKPVIISTGIASFEDIVLAVETCRKAGNNQIALLKCTSSYPAPINEANLRMIPKLSEDFNVITGLSDHTIGNIVPIVSTILGGKIIEKHFILDKSLGGPDASFSMDETEFKNMVDSVRQAERSLGKDDYLLTQKQINSKNLARSLYITQDVKKGEFLSKENVKSIRPGYGLHPKYYEEVIGKKFNKDYEKGERLNFNCINND